MKKKSSKKVKGYAEIKVNISPKIVKAFKKELNYYKVYSDLIQKAPKSMVNIWGLTGGEKEEQPKKVSWFDKLRLKVAWKVGGKPLQNEFDELQDELYDY